MSNSIREAARKALDAMNAAVPTGEIRLSEWSEAKIALRTALAGEQAPQAVELPALPDPTYSAKFLSLFLHGSPQDAYAAAVVLAYATEAVSAALAAQADKPAVQAVPLTPDQLADKCEAWLQGPDNFMCTNPVDAFEEGFRAAEVHHGVTGAKP